MPESHSNTKIKVLIVDDHVIVREGIRILLDTQPVLAKGNYYANIVILY